MTKLQVIQAIQRRLKTPESTSLTDMTGHWPAPELIDRCNEAELEVCRATGCLYDYSLVSSVASTREYAFESDWGEIMGILWDNKPLVPLTIDQMDNGEMALGAEQQWRTLTAADPESWGLADKSGYFFVYKTPTATETDIMTVLHTLIPTAWTSSDTTSDLPFNNLTHLTPYHALLVWYVVAECLEEDATEESDWARVNVYRGKFEKGAQRLRGMVQYPKWALPTIQFTGGAANNRRPSWGSGRYTS